MTELQEENILHYGVPDVTPIPMDIVNERVGLLEAHLAKLMESHFMHHDNNAINKAIKDIHFWKKLSGEQL